MSTIYDHVHYLQPYVNIGRHLSIIYEHVQYLQTGVHYLRP